MIVVLCLRRLNNQKGRCWTYGIAERLSRAGLAVHQLNQARNRVLSHVFNCFRHRVRLAFQVGYLRLVGLGYPSGIPARHNAFPQFVVNVSVKIVRHENDVRVCAIKPLSQGLAFIRRLRLPGQPRRKRQSQKGDQREPNSTALMGDEFHELG